MINYYHKLVRLVKNWVKPIKAHIELSFLSLKACLRVCLCNKLGDDDDGAIKT